MRPTRLLLMLALFVALFAFSIPAFAEYDPNAALPRPTNSLSAVRNEDGYLVVFTDNLFMRSGDDVAYTPVAILDGGTYLIVRGANGQGGDLAWWYVEAGGIRGWVKDSFVAVRGDLSDTPVVDSDGTLTPPTLYVGYPAPVYDFLTASGDVICETTGNQSHVVLAKNAEAATWFKIHTFCGGRGVDGWVWAERGILRNPAGLDIPVAS